MIVVRDHLKSVFLLNSTDGHRVTWIQEIMSQSTKKGEIEFWICGDYSAQLSEFQLKISSEGGEVPTVRFFENSRKLRIHLRSLAKENLNIKFTSLDGESWLLYKLFVRTPLRILIMRPYLTQRTALSFFNFALKKLMIWAIYLKDNEGVRCLSIPGWTPKFFLDLWVDDDLFQLLFSESVFSNILEEKNSSQVLVPGFISLRKNPRVVLDAMSIINKDFNHLFRVNFAGSIQDEVLTIVSDYDEDLVKINNLFLDSQQFYGLISDSHCVVLLYKNVGASRIVTESLILGTPVIMQYNRKLVPLSRISNGYLVLVRKIAKELANVIVDLPRIPQPLDQFQRNSILHRSLKMFLLGPTNSGRD